MRSTDFLSESEHTELKTLTEGPLGSLVKAAGRGLGKAVGGVAKGAGAVAGGVAGIGSAFKKGYQSGKTTVAGDDDADSAAAPAANAPAANAPAAPKDNTAQPTAQSTKPEAEPAVSKPPAQPQSTATTEPPADPNATPKPTAVPKADTDTAKPLAGTGSETEPTADAAKETEYAKALKFVKGLPVAQQKELVAMLQKDPKVTAAMNRPAANKDVEEPAQGLSPEKFGQMAQSLAGSAQKTADAKPKTAPAKDDSKAKDDEPDLTDPNVPISQAIRRRQAQGLAAGYKNPNTMIREQFSLFRKQ